MDSGFFNTEFTENTESAEPDGPEQRVEAHPV